MIFKMKHDISWDSLTSLQQIGLLHQQGLSIKHISNAENAINEIGFENLSIYMPNFRVKGDPSLFKHGSCLDKIISMHYFDIRLQALILKQLHDLSDETVVEQWKQNPYFQAFCGMTEFQLSIPCHSTELVKFRNRIGKDGFEKIFQMSVQLHGCYAQEKVVNIDTTVQEKNITYPTDAKLAINIINRLNKLAKKQGIKQRS